MNELMENPAFHTYAICSAILAIKMLFTGNFTTFQRMRNKGFVNDEDGRIAGVQVESVEHPAVAHALRIQRNDLENILLFFAVGLIFVLDGASASAATAYFWTFTIARIVHWVVYLNHLQPWRAICYSVGYLCILGMAVQIIL